MQTARYEHIRDFLRDHRYYDLEREVLPKLHAHPDYPSLFAITDTFRQLEIEHIALKADPDNLPDLPDRFLAVIKSFTGSDIVYAHKKNGAVHVRFSNDYRLKFSLSEFREVWMGIVVAVEENPKRENRSQPRWSYVIAAASIVFSFASLLLSDAPIVAYCYHLLSWIGLGISILAVRTQQGITDDATARLCRNGSKSSCSDVVSAEGAKILRKFSMGELACSYFLCVLSAVGFLGYQNSASFLAVLSMAAVPLLIWSLYFQGVVVKKWCALCLSLAAILIFQLLIQGIPGAPSLAFSSIGIICKIGALGLIAFTVTQLYVSQLSMSAKAASYTARFHKLSRNFSIFNTLLAQEKDRGEIPQEWPAFFLGTPNNPVQFELVISASCRHCHRAFARLSELALQNPGVVSVRLLLNINPENRDNPFNLVYRIAYSQLLSGNTEKGMAALADWHLGDHDLHRWTEKYGALPTMEQADELLWAYYDWCREQELFATPSVLINRKKIPAQYQPDDLHYFVRPLLEETKTLAVPFV